MDWSTALEPITERKKMSLELEMGCDCSSASTPGRQPEQVSSEENPSDSGLLVPHGFRSTNEPTVYIAQLIKRQLSVNEITALNKSRGPAEYVGASTRDPRPARGRP